MRSGKVLFLNDGDLVHFAKGKSIKDVTYADFKRETMEQIETHDLVIYSSLGGIHVIKNKYDSNIGVFISRNQILEKFKSL